MPSHLPAAPRPVPLLALLCWVLPAVAGAAPDLTLSRFTTRATATGATIGITFCNTGDAMTAAHVVRLFAERRTAPACRDTGGMLEGARLPGLAAGACVSADLPLDLTGVPSGSYRLALMVDADCEVTERSEADNTKVAVLSVRPGAANLSLRPLTVLAAGGTIVTRGSICNAGAAARPVRVRLWYDRAGGAVTCSSPGADLDEVVDPPAPGSCLDFLLVRAGLTAATRTAVVMVDAGCQVAESDESDNSRSFVYRVPGDTARDLPGRWELEAFIDSGRPKTVTPGSCFYDFRAGKVYIDCPPPGSGPPGCRSRAGAPYAVVGGGAGLRVSFSPVSPITWRVLGLGPDRFAFEEGGDRWYFRRVSPCR